MNCGATIDTLTCKNMRDTDIQPAPVLDLRSPTESKWQLERAAFLRLHSQLLHAYRDKYVAIREETVVDSGDDLVAMALRAYERFGYVPIYCDLVTERLPAPERIPSPRVV